VAVLERGRAIVAVDDPHGNALAQALRLAPGAALQAGRVHGAVEAQDEELLLVDLRALPGQHARGEGAAGVEGVGLRIPGLAALRLERRVGGERAAHARRQLAAQVDHPFALAVPARAAAGQRIAGRARAAQRERRRGARVAGVDGRAVELDDDLAHAADLALRRDLADAQRQRRAGHQAGGQRKGPGQRPGDGRGRGRHPSFCFLEYDCITVDV
jgi:hypothetical protein